MISLLIHFNRFDKQLGAMFKIPLCKRQILPRIADSPFLLSESPLLPLSGWHRVEVHFECSDPSRKSLDSRYPSLKSHNRLQISVFFSSPTHQRSLCRFLRFHVLHQPLKTRSIVTRPEFEPVRHIMSMPTHVETL